MVVVKVAVCQMPDGPCHGRPSPWIPSVLKWLDEGWSIGENISKGDVVLHSGSDA